MGVIPFLAVNDIRRRWRAALGVALLIGVVGTLVFATAAGARRSATALERFNAYSRSADVELALGFPPPSKSAVDAFLRDAHVIDVARLNAYAMTVDARPNVAIAASVDGKTGTVMDRARLIEGRRPNPARADEVAIGEALAQQTGLDVGSTITVRTITPDELLQIIAGRATPEFRGPKLALRVVGLVRHPLDLSDRAASGGVILLSPAFDREYRSRVALFSPALRLRVGGGEAGVQRVTAVARKHFATNAYYSASDARAENRAASNAVNVITTTLWLFAVVAALAGLAAVAIVVAREMSRIAGDQPVLRACGVLPRECVAAVLPRALVMVVGGIVLAVVGAVALSPLLPFGIARRADPNPGLHTDWTVLGIGALATAAIVLGVAIIAATRAVHAAVPRPVRTRARRRRVAVAQDLLRSGLPLTVANGARMAVDSGDDGRRVPARSAFLGAVVGVLGVTAVLVYAGSLHHLVDSPARYGWTFDVALPDEWHTPCTNDDFGVHRRDDVAAVAAVCYQRIHIEDTTIWGWGFTPVKGTIAPTVIAGRAPLTDSEVALGSQTLDDLGRDIGDTVTVRGETKTRTYSIVGRVAIPQLKTNDTQPIDDVASFTGAGLRRLDMTNVTRFVLVRFDSGADHDRAITALASIPEFNPLSPSVPRDAIARPTLPPDVERVRNVGVAPALLAGLVAAFGLVAVGHGLVTSVRHRRRELAVFKALGFDRGQVRMTIAWQATTLALAGVVVGVPLGLVAGQLAWRAVAGTIGVATDTRIPYPAIVMLAVATIGLVNLVATLPARAAARARPAVTLAAE